MMPTQFKSPTVSQLSSVTRAVLVAIAMFLAASAVSAAPLRWGADAEGGAPYIFKDPNDPNRNIGFEVDLAEALARAIGEGIEFKQYEYKSLFLGLDRGDIDFAMNGLELTPDRADRFRLSVPYYFYALQLVARRGDGHIVSLDECKKANCTVGTLEETAAQRLLTRRQIKTKLYDGQVEPYQDCALQRIDAVLLDLPIAIYYAAQNPKLAFVGEPFDRGQYVIAFRKDREELAARFDAALGQLARDGDLRRIYEKWKMWNDDQVLGAAPSPAVSAAMPPSLSSSPAAAPAPTSVASSGDVTTDSAQQWTWRRTLPLLLDGAVVTVGLSVASMTLAVILGLLVAVARLYGPGPVRLIALGYVEFFRGIPVLLLLYFLYYGLPAIAETYHLGTALRLSPVQAAVLGFGLNYAAFEAEIYRAGVLSVPSGQWEAAEALGMSRSLAFRRIILPQAIRTVLPPMTNDFVALFKDTSLVSIIAVVELSKQYQILSKSSMRYLELGLLTAAIYLCMSMPLAALARRLEQRWSRGA
jgi:polar amino acid transport system substrate-binding protein